LIESGYGDIEMSRKDASQNDRTSSRWDIWKRRLSVAGAAAAVVGICIAVRSIHGPDAASARDPNGRAVQQTAATAAVPQKPQVLAIVNNEQIGRQELAQECLTHYGKEVLEAMVNKYLIVQYCQQQGVTITKDEVNAEIERTARKFKITIDQWLKMLEQERGIDPDQYANDVVWPTLALKKLAADRLEPTPQELQEAFETQYGEAVKARIIIVKDAATAKRVAAQAKSDPERFGALAVSYSIDASASSNGMVPPIRWHLGDKQIEQWAFHLQPGEVSDAIPYQGQFAILKCEGRLPASNARPDQVKEKLAEAIRERKLHGAAEDVFKELHAKAVVQNVFNDPVKSQQMPGVAAVVNDRKITVRELAEECIDRHGKEVLEGTINRRLLEQAVKNKKITITDADLNAEVARAALAMGKFDKQRRPDVNAWIKAVTEEQGITVETYYHDAVWPSVALKKLVGEVQVTNEDMHRGFTANYGPRAICRVIMAVNEHKAQEVWELARADLQKKDRDPEFFGKLAEQYSIDASRALRGRVPPIQRYGGMTQLEEEAFKLKPGELSSIIAVGDKYVILYCEGYTDPQKVEMADVKDLLYEDIHEKKIRVAMADEFNRIRDSAQIDNYLAKTSQSPKTSGAAGHGTKDDKDLTTERAGSAVRK
jgi:parvulin-like peptidyl-prolyl isomerase